MTLSPVELSLALTAVAAGAAIQGSIGFGFSFVAAPVITLFVPRALPATLLFLALPMTGFMALRERHAIDLGGFAWITAGRVLGTAAGAALLVAVPADWLSVLFGSMIAAGAGVSLLGPSFEARARTRFVAGAASGVMGTAAAVGGPPLALVEQASPGPVLRSTLAVSFLVGLAMSLGALWVAGEVRGLHLRLAVQLLPALLGGLLGSRLLVRVLDERWLRPAVLAFAAAAGSAAVVKGLVG
ncbi:MAG TPA: sulfite exporter TauE/SafE family protein [Actinomycetota bacterium]|nr:sulfite exporter TauE/SafE family protein [Actinomycetota bacterium]